MENRTTQELATVPFVVYESLAEKNDRQQKRLIAVILTLVFLLFASNIAWIIYLNQYDYVDSMEISSEQDGEGVNIIGAGVVDYGAESEDQGN